MNDRKVHQKISNLIEEHGNEDKEELRQYLERITYKDDLTGLWNRRYIDEILPTELAMSFRREKPVSFVFLDLVALDEINNNQGRDKGDEALKTIAVSLIGGKLKGEILKNWIRKTDVVGRYGEKADEFGIILRDTGSYGSWKAADGAKKIIEGYDLSVSGGVASSEIVGVPLLYGMRGREIIKGFSDNDGSLEKTKNDIITYLTLLKREGKRVFTREQMKNMLTNVYGFLKSEGFKGNLDLDYEEIGPKIITKYADTGLQLAKEKGKKRIYAHGEHGFGSYNGNLWVPLE